MAHYSAAAHKSDNGLNVLPSGDLGARTRREALFPSFIELSAALGFSKRASLPPCCWSCRFPWKGAQVPRLAWSTAKNDGLGSARPDSFQVSQQVRVKSMDKELSHLLDSKDSTQSP